MLTAEVSRTGAGDALLELRAGGTTTGVRVPSTGDRYAWTTISRTLPNGLQGVHDLRFTLHGEQRLAAFRLSRST